MSTSGGSGGGGGIQVATATVTGAQLTTLFSAPVEILAGVAGSAHGVIFSSLSFVAGAVGFDQFDPLVLYDDASAAVNAASNAFWLAPQFANVIPPSVFAVSSAVTSDIETGQLYPRAAVIGEPLVLGQLSSDSQRAGPIVTSTRAAGGLGYVAGDTGTVDMDFYTGGAAYVIDTVGALGVALTYHLTNAGNGYSTEDNPLDTTVGGAQPGVGTGFQVNVTAIPPDDGTLYVTVLYRTINLH